MAFILNKNNNNTEHTIYTRGFQPGNRELELRTPKNCLKHKVIIHILHNKNKKIDIMKNIVCVCLIITEYLIVNR